jgi:mono/diheme cytochrome c family protein
MEGESLANMMKRLKGIFLFTALSAFMLMISPDAGAQQKKGEPWIIPSGYKVMTNPLAADTAIIRAGQLAYDRKCALCHGKRGLGDGPRGKMSKIFPGDLSGQEFQNLSDGEIFYQTKFGRGEMPAYEKRSSDTEIWSMVHYMRTMRLKKN